MKVGARAAAVCADLPVGPGQSAKAAGLRYVSDAMPGIRRIPGRRGFHYLTASGDPIRDATTLERIRALAIPPAWRDVWICPSEDGHLQAVGRDARNRKQYRYHPRWRAVRDEVKYGHVIAFGHALPAIRQKTRADMSLPGYPREKLLATVIFLLETTLIRVGNDEYARVNDSFGLTTLRPEHLELSRDKVRFRFCGKSGRQHQVDITDRRVARILRKMVDLPGEELFQYLDENGAVRDVTADDVNAYLRGITSQPFTAKDFRTWAGTVLTARALERLPDPASKADARRNINLAISAVSDVMGNTRAVCRQCYVHPDVLLAYERGILKTELARHRFAPASPGLDDAETAVLRLLERGIPTVQPTSRAPPRSRRTAKA